MATKQSAIAAAAATGFALGECKLSAAVAV